MPEATLVYNGLRETIHPIWTSRLGKEKEQSNHHTDTFKRQSWSFWRYPPVSVFTGDKGTQES